MSVPVIDLFAGPGGLGEGFSRQAAVDFRIAVSIEKDRMAHETLRLRAAHRFLTRSGKATDATWHRWDSLVDRAPWNLLFYMLRDCGDSLIASACNEAEIEAQCFELGIGHRSTVSDMIRKSLTGWMRGNELPGNAVLIGGPPCQAYSIVGRSRNRGIDGYKAEEDHRHFLYREYLHVIAEFRPAIFVMENVKGILTSRVNDRQIFETILEDLRRPDLTTKTDLPVEYELLSLPRSAGLLGELAPEDYIVRAEEHGVPQARHRVIILGVRKDVLQRVKNVPLLASSVPPTVGEVISDLPKLTPRVSYRGKGLSERQTLDDSSFDHSVRFLRDSANPVRNQVAELMQRTRNRLRVRHSVPGNGSDRAWYASGQRPAPARMTDWYRDRPISLLTNHASRSHMPSDLVRYLFVAVYGEITGQSPHLSDFPPCLLPQHKNVDPDKVRETIFKDRFRVQLADRHGMTVTSHIAKDGHAFIHPDANQFRSLTVREAARLQSFPDSYVFLGNRTSQYTQVGNAVPPYLAFQIAGVVAELLKEAGLNT